MKINCGSIYLFDFSTSRPIWKAKALDAKAKDQFGFSLSLKDGYIACGANYCEGKTFNGGAAYLFQISGSNQIYKVTDPHGAVNDKLGNSVAVNSNYLVVAASYADTQWTNAGAVCVFERSSGRFLRKLEKAAGHAGDAFGCSVAMDANRAIVGACFNDEKQPTRGRPLFIT